MTNFDMSTSSSSPVQSPRRRKTLSAPLLASPRLLKRYRYSVMPSNDELNNKIDLEIRILDGILKLLNAISNAPLSTSSEINHSSTSTTVVNPLDAHIMQILTACKCLFVSHRKIAIYLNDLNTLPTMDSLASGKLYLSSIRIPLSWKWNDYVRATKNSESVTTKHAVFALIYLGNMVYDRQLLTNVDATCTEISFNENFIFEDVNVNDFELRIEIYSYEIFNTTTNNLIIQSARKLAKQLTDFVRKSTPPLQQQQQHALHSTSSSSTTSTLLQPSLLNDPYSYSTHRFKLCAQSILRSSDLSESVETRNLQIINENDHQFSGSCMTLNSLQPQQQSVNKLPLFDQFSVKLRSSTPVAAATTTLTSNIVVVHDDDEIF